MRGPPLLLLLALQVAAAAPAPAPSPAPSPAPALLVLRSACNARDPSLFDPSALRGYARAVNRSIALRELRLVSYNETCGPSWRASLMRSVWAALEGGGAVAFAGRADAALCGAWRAARGERPLPGGCARAAARGAAVAQVAARLRWQRALLAAHARCAPDARPVAHALAAGGLRVRRRPLARAELDRRPHVIILCSTDVRAVRWLARRRSAAPAPTSAPALLLLHLAPAVSYDTQTQLRVNLSAILEMLFSKSDDKVQLGEATGNHHNGSHEVAEYEHDEASEKETNGSRRRRSVGCGGACAGGGRPLVLSDEVLEERHGADTSAHDVYSGALDAVEGYVEADTARRERARDTFYLYESGAQPGAGLWVQLVADSERALDGDGDWTTAVTIVDPGGALRRRSSPDVVRSDAAVAVLAALAGCGALALGAGGALAWRRKRSGRGPRAAPVLAAADFEFPADERRVGDGMESMVCWLQQLHGCGAAGRPPDLLRRAAPAPPSAPSSTCSVSRLAPDHHTRYKGEPVHARWLPAGALQLRRRALDVLLVMQALRHENVNPFLGCLAEARPALVFEACGRGSLEDVLVADDIRLDWTFRLSLLTDLARGMRYLHASPLRAHGRLSSRNCVVDARWVLRVTDYGAAAFARAQALPLPRRCARELLWTAPELLREGLEAREGRGTPSGDVFSFGIVMQEVIVRGEPFCMLSLTPEEIVEKLRRPPPLVRPSVSLGAAPPEAVRLMRQCWSEAPEQRPDFARVYEHFRHMHRGRKINIVDSMFEMLEKYSNNLEELIKERTEQLDMEKKKTEQLLNRMLPRSVAERLMAGARVEPEEFEEVSVYFSDIVGFTELAARSTPVQVVDLLNDLYTTFDAAIEQYRVYKVETIGDAYMVVGGLPARTRDHAESVATMALQLLHLAGRFRVRHLPGTPLHLRSGLHSGPCCAAVVGLTMPRYCLFGDTVNTAARMESTGAAWRIQVSAATAERLAAAGGYRLRSRGLRHVKGKGLMHTYWLLGKDGFDKPLPAPPPLPSEEVLLESDSEVESERPGASAAPRDPASVDPATRDPGDPRAPRPRTLSDADEDCLASRRGLRAERAAWARSGAVSADSSPPRAARTPPRVSHARYRCLAGASGLRRQWSLERGDELAAAAARTEPLADLLAEPLALRVPPPRAPPRYRTRSAQADAPRPL